ncbi:hypothetical protein KP79_PYT06224 [Mizuhopecten yessoensis]|uniref:Uncharacterized protein n=1 Tax=Mizuhopecten yessoensis TaxID=6573 RepID=A0A210QG91_MIZYE|nr:hypothetical protein KP79_PYT06224 [Mizuhopecten yessoensis]
MVVTEMFDFKQLRWVSYVPEYDKSMRHVEDMAEGRAKAYHKGRYVVGSGSNHRKTTDTPNIKMVTPVAQAVEMARAELRRKQTIRRGKRVADTQLD